ncbi:arylsulfotransferase protein [Purpureocillium lilacinum]|uniref:Arylsulfotransferase protein n=1 Tax=Purpureocillium lilacinum TaxID=33203 RepID=A0A179HPH9_PURLI|nr:arylsulfotransferase protein [Purpureocillium lilacinum]OAQ91350.1 arylsulfotransferase protein [Purpureocillium lilacinum]
MQPSCSISSAAIAIQHLLLPLSLLLTGCVSAEQPVFTDSAEFDNETFGKYPVQTFKSTPIVAPRPNFLLRDNRCESDLYTFLTPRGYVEAARNAQMTILDQGGHLVWTSGWEGKQIYNLMVQRYRGHNYLTFWAGNDAVGGHGAGTYYMLDEAYTLRHTIKAGNNLQGDLHDFRLTDRGTALMTVYEVREHDLSSMGKKKGPIWDCLIQEMDIETGDVVFQWRAAEHFNISDTYRGIGGEGEPGGAPFDWFHINSIDKDRKGNYLISSRYMSNLAYIDGRTGDVLWTLGGKKNMFKDLSGGKATNFRYQHDATWDLDYTEITLFDNSDLGKLSDASRPRGMRIKVDQEARTVRLIAEYRNPQHIPAESQGSTQTLPGGNVVVGFGFTAVWTEFTHDGTPLCDVHYGSQSRFGTGDVQSYRVVKFAWKGFPTTTPDLAVAQDDAGVWRVYASWNGATEVADWVLQGEADDENGGDASDWQVIETTAKDGFETDFVLDADHPQYLRAVALDSKGNALGTSKVLDAGNVTVDYEVPKPEPTDNIAYTRETVALGAGVVVGMAFVGICVLARPAMQVWRRSDLGRKTVLYKKLSTDGRRSSSEAV